MLFSQSEVGNNHGRRSKGKRLVPSAAFLKDKWTWSRVAAGNRKTRLAEILAIVSVCLRPLLSGGENQEQIKQSINRNISRKHNVVKKKQPRLLCSGPFWTIWKQRKSFRLARRMQMTCLPVDICWKDCDSCDGSRWRGTRLQWFVSETWMERIAPVRRGSCLVNMICGLVDPTYQLSSCPNSWGRET